MTPAASAPRVPASLPPLLFEPILRAKVWGGDRLRDWGKPVRAGARIGESWEIADLASTSADGAGGDAARSVIARGPLAGTTLSALVRDRRDEVLGRCRADSFPLLIKFLDARENLSVQVHPSPEYAAEHPEAHLKFESWYILDAAPGSVIYKGVRAGLTRERFAEHIRDGSVVEDLIAIPARTGDCHHLPSGTVHALGAGVLVAEVQTPSDTTFRVFDWGRVDRALHIEQALACAIMSPPKAGDLRRADGSARGELGGTRYYGLAELRFPAGEAQSIADADDSPRVWMWLAGSGAIESANGAFEPVPVRRGATLLLPASIGPVRVSTDAESVVLEAVPTV